MRYKSFALGLMAIGAGALVGYNAHTLKHLVENIDVVAPYDAPRDHLAVPCPSAADALVIVAFGQSNGANHGTPRLSDDSGQVYNYYQGKCYKAADPMLGATGRGGSIWVPFGQQLAQLTGKKIVFSTFGVGGSTIQRWEDPKDLGARMDSNLKALQTTYPTIAYFLWIQGESEAEGTVPAYGKALEHVAQIAWSYYPETPFGVSSTSFCMDTMNSALAAEQKRIATTTKGFFWLGDTDQFRSAGYRRDNCHFNAGGTKAVVDEFITHITPLLKRD